MDARVAARLLALNREFYQTFSADFAQTRERLQPGVAHIAREVPRQVRLLDLGCGRGQLARHLLAEKAPRLYLGLDLSLRLLHLARGAAARAGESALFACADLSARALPLSPATRFDWAFVFAVLHHLPGFDLRLRTCQEAHRRLVPGGRLALSNWQFSRSERLRRRVVPWAEIGLGEHEVDLGDALLDWRRGGRGLRYVHQVEQTERLQLCHEAGFREIENFASDGEGGDLSDYAVWEAV
ncbi:MAG: class I SAM-dependent methyltransferase [Chloroflexi bacterium]|nr:class I SAM-dependent methyltransferase [Chloroflexota bacterium]